MKDFEALICSKKPDSGTPKIKLSHELASWFRTAKNRDVYTGQHACPLNQVLARLIILLSSHARSAALDPSLASLTAKLLAKCESGCPEP